MRGYVIQETTPVYDFPSLAIVSLWFGVALIGVTAVTELVPTSLWMTPIIDSMHLILVALLLASVVCVAFQVNGNFRISALPLVINLGVLMICYLVPFQALWQEMRFQWYLVQYNELIALVESGQIPVSGRDSDSNSGFAFLPAGYEHLSQDGLILIEQENGVTRIFFFETRLTTWHFSGYIYRSDGNPPQQGEFGGRWQHIKAKRPYWFWCDSY